MESLMKEHFCNKLFMKYKLVIKCDIYMVYLKGKAKIITWSFWLWNIVEQRENNLMS